MLRSGRGSASSVGRMTERPPEPGLGEWQIAFLAVFCVHLAAYVFVSSYAVLSIVGHHGAPDANIGLAFCLAAYEGLALPWSLTVPLHKEDLGSVVLASLNLVVHLIVCATALTRGRSFGRRRRRTG